jgi:F-type H+-transporting ATPase subunit delta
VPELKQHEVVSDRYAKGLMGAIEDPAVLDEVANELAAIAELVADDRALRAFLEGPDIPTEDKLKLVNKAFGGRVQPVLLDFIHLLMHKNRVDILRGVAHAFQHLVEARRNQMRTKVIAAVPLRPDALDRLKRALDGTTGRDCILEPEVDARIVGGLVVVLDDRVIDGSIRTALDDLKHKLLEAPL